MHALLNSQCLVCLLRAETWWTLLLSDDQKLMVVDPPPRRSASSGGRFRSGSPLRVRVVEAGSATPVATPTDDVMGSCDTPEHHCREVKGQTSGGQHARDLQGDFSNFISNLQTAI